MTFKSINPATGQTLAEFPAHTPAQVDQALSRAREAAPLWRHTPVAERAALVGRLGALRERPIEPTEKGFGSLRGRASAASGSGPISYLAGLRFSLDCSALSHAIICPV